MVHPAVTVVREFNRECDAIDRACEQIARQLSAGQISEQEFDREAERILGSDY